MRTRVKTDVHDAQAPAKNAPMLESRVNSFVVRGGDT